MGLSIQIESNHRTSSPGSWEEISNDDKIPFYSRREYEAVWTVYCGERYCPNVTCELIRDTLPAW